ncbi:VIT and VWA domain-containing protein [Limnohabitans sp.]|uniref:VIT and vWA domain-containing protein n=1 Tax=Limnohabitans sp. TaxID=1907725 RepID=UPI00333F12DF
MQANKKQIGLHAQDMEANIGLVSAHVTGRLNGLVAQIKVRQVYKNWSDDNVECVYTFPLGWQSVLLGMRVELNGKSMTGTVKPKKVAEAQYEEAISSGDLPVMLERSGKDLYTANIGNIQTGDEVVIELDYAQILKAEDGAIRFSLPTTIAPRYGDASAAGLKLHQQAEANPQAEHRLFLNLELSENLSQGTVYSPSHEIQLSPQGNQCSLKLEGAAWLDRDFVLVIDRLGDMNFAVAAHDSARPGEAKVLTGGVYRPTGYEKQHPISIKVLVDCSGSMQGDSIEQAKDCLNWLFGQLNNTDQVSFTRFGSSVHHDHSELKPCTLIYRQLLKASSRRLNADLGGTEIDDALKEVIAIQSGSPEESKNAVILLITDGEVWNIEEIIATVRASGQRIYAVGVGSAPSESLLKDMADVTGGASEMVTPRESMQKAVERLLIQIRQTQAIEQEVTCKAPIVWQSKSKGHAAAGSSLMSWTQINTQGSPLDELKVVQTVYPNGEPTPCPVIWDESLDLSRIAAALRLNDLTKAKERERLAVEYQLVTSETNLILVHERAENEKADDLPELHQVRPMLAAGWSGNGAIAYSRKAPSLQVMRTGCDNVPFIAESRIDMSMSVPAMWRSNRSHSAARVDGMANAGMDDIEIPAFLRKQESSSDSKPVKTFVQKFKDIVSTPNKQPQSTHTVKKPQGTSDELKAILASKTITNNPVHELLSSFNQVALTHTRFRSALAACLRTNQANYMEWLITKHMKAAGSGAPIWAIFISWAAENLSVELDRHAERILRDFLSPIDSDLQQAIYAELSELKQEAAV